MSFEVQGAQGEGEAVPAIGLIQGISFVQKLRPVFQALKSIGATEVRLNSWAKAIDKTLNHSNVILNTACVASYVAMIALGMPVQGSIGLAGMGLSYLKQAGWIPNKVEKVLEVAQLISNVLILSTLSLSTFSIIVNSISTSLQLLSLASNWESLEGLIPEWLYYPTPGTHKINQERMPLAFVSLPGGVGRRLEETTAAIENHSLFRVNSTHIHAPEVSCLVSLEQKNDLNALNANRLLERFKQRCISLGVLNDDDIEDATRRLEEAARQREADEVGPTTPANEAEQENLLGSSLATAFVRLKNALIYDTVDDGGFARLSGLKLGLKACLYSLLEEEDDGEFETKAAEWVGILADNCTHGWLREISYLLQPKGSDYRWGIHNALATMRTDIVQEALKEVATIIDAKTGGILSVDAVGGINGVHIVDPIHSGLWTMFRTNFGERERARNGNIFTNIWYRFYQPGNIDLLNRLQVWADESQSRLSKMWAGLDLWLASMEVHAGVAQSAAADSMAAGISFLIGLSSLKMKFGYTLERMIDLIETQIVFDKITKDMRIKCMQDLHGKYPDLEIIDGESIPNQAFVSENGEYTFTKKMITLMLWDMGVVEFAGRVDADAMLQRRRNVSETQLQPERDRFEDECKNVMDYSDEQFLRASRSLNARREQQAQRQLANT